MNCFCFGKKGRGNIFEDKPIVRPKQVARDPASHEKHSAPSTKSVIDDQENQRRTTESVPQLVKNETRLLVKEDGLTQLAPSLVPENLDARRFFDLDIVAIHGLGGDPRTTWMDSESGIAWLEDYLPKDLPNARIFTYGYNANVKLSNSIADVDDWARALLKNLSLEREESYGALVIAHEQERYRAMLESTKAIIFFGTPHRGSAIADFASNATSLTHVPSTLVDFVFGVGKIRRDLLKTLRTDSKDLDRLTLSFKERAQSLDEILSFYERKTIHNMIVVELESASIGAPKEEVVALEATHTEMCRLKDTGSLAYMSVKALCKRFSGLAFECQKPLSSQEARCLQSLKPEDHQEPDTDRAPNTCEWILEEFDTWRKRGEPILWVSGELGHGKTTLLFFLKDQLRGTYAQSKKHQADPTICSFFCDSRSEVLTDMRLIIRRILWEILSKRHDLVHHAVTYFDECSSWSRDSLWRVFEAVITDSKANDTFILVDALDECSESVRNEFFNRLASCYQELQRLSRRTINFVLSSRSRVVDRDSGLKTFSTYLKLDEDNSLRQFIHTDIENYAAMTLSKLLYSHRKNEGDVALLAKSIANRSEGSFLWAALVMERAQEQFFGDFEHLEQILAECPPKLEGIYYQYLQGIDDYYRQKTRKAFSLILTAKRPLTLAEFEVALAIDSDYQILETLNASQDQRSDFQGFMSARLGIFIKKDANVITYRHEAVKDFIFNKIHAFENKSYGGKGSKVSTWLDLSEEKAEQIMARCCVSLLKLDDFGEAKSSLDMQLETWEESGLGSLQIDSDASSPTAVASTPPSLDKSSQKFKTPFYEYASSQWGYHYASIAPGDDVAVHDDEIMTLMRSDFLDSWSTVFRKMYHGNDRLPQELDPLLVAAYFGHKRNFRRLFSDPEYALSRERGLTWASRMGHREIVEHAINSGISYATNLLDGSNAFSWAVEKGFFKIVELFLAKDSTLVNVQNQHGDSPLSLAVGNGHSKIVRTLLMVKNIDVNLANKDGLTAIHMAITGPLLSENEKRILQMLLKRRELDIAARDRRGRTVLWYAADVGSAQAIKLLLQNWRKQETIDKLLIDCGDNAGETPLFRAAFYGHVEAIQTLCETKRIQHQFESVDNLDGANVFDIAAKRGNVSSIDVLGRYYPRGVNSQDFTGRTPISVAMWQNNITVLRVLRKYGADGNLADYHRRTPISHGVLQTRFVKYLVEECGADINLPDKDGHTPFWYAKHSIDQIASGTEKLEELISIGAKE